MRKGVRFWPMSLLLIVGSTVVCISASAQSPAPAPTTATPPTSSAPSSTGAPPVVAPPKAESGKETTDVPSPEVAAATSKLQEQLAEAQKEKAVAEVKQAYTEASLANMKAGKLISSGFTGGVALSTLALVSNDRVVIEQPFAVAAMPYIAIHPFYWAKSDAARAYCADTFIGGNKNTGAAAAQAIEVVTAKAALAGLIAGARSGRFRKRRADEWNPGMKGENIANVTYCAPPDVDHDDDPCAIYDLNEKQAKAVIDGDYAKLAKEGSEAREDWLLDATHRRWNPTLAGKCGSTRFGVYFGINLPTKVDVSSRGGSIAVTEQSYNGIFSTGFVFAPSAYFSILAGIAHGRVRPSADAGQVPVWGANLGLGGNLDLIGLFAGK